jgi:hypothetical protein
MSFNTFCWFSCLRTYERRLHKHKAHMSLKQHHPGYVGHQVYARLAYAAILDELIGSLPHLRENAPCDEHIPLFLYKDFGMVTDSVNYESVPRWEEAQRHWEATQLILGNILHEVQRLIKLARESEQPDPVYQHYQREMLRTLYEFQGFILRVI